MSSPISSTSQSGPKLALTEIESLKSTLKGNLLLPDNDMYDQSRTVWNAMIDRYPALIVQCKEANDVINAVNFARKHNLLLSVKGGGHNVAGNAVCDDGLMIDFSLMKGIQIDESNQTVRVEPGLSWGELDEETQKYGLATTGGTVSLTGVAGLTLGGGLGWLMATHGLSCDNLISAELVSYDGQLLTVSDEQNPDLYWAIRGGGGNYGVITSFQFQLHNVGPTVLGGMVLYPMEQAKEVLYFYREFSRNSPDELTVFAGLLSTPEGIPVVAIMVGWFGALEEGEKQLAPLQSFGTPMANLISPLPYVELQKLLDGAAKPRLHRYWKSGYFNELSDELIDIIVDHTLGKISPYSAFVFFHIHGAASRVDPNATAFGFRQNHWDIDIISQWADPDETQQQISWARTFWQAMEPLSHGVYVNHLDADDGRPRVKAAYQNTYARLAEIKAKYDPHNFFRMNNNILPA